MSYRKVMIGTPSYDGRVSAHYAYAVGEVMRACAGANVDPYYRFRLFDSLVQRSRNDLLADARELDVDDLVMIDDDQAFDPECFFRLLPHPVDCVGFPVRKKGNDEAYNVKYTKALPIPRAPGTNLLMVDAVGTGFLRLSRRAIGAVWATSDPYQSNGREVRWVFDVRPEEGAVRGEDIALCHRLADLGIQAYVDDSTTISHCDGTITWGGDFRSFLGKLEAKAAAKGPPDLSLVHENPANMDLSHV